MNWKHTVFLSYIAGSALAFNSYVLGEALYSFGKWRSQPVLCKQCQATITNHKTGQ